MKKLTVEQLKNFYKLQRLVFEKNKAEAEARISQFNAGLITFGELGLFLVKLDKAQEKEILEIRRRL